MKTHPDSIFVPKRLAQEVAAFDAGDNYCAMVIRSESHGDEQLEFIPASAYLEAVRERDEAMARLKDVEAERIGAIKEMAKAREEAAWASSKREISDWILGEEAENRGGQFKRLYDKLQDTQGELDRARATIARLRTAEDNADTQLTAIRNALTEAGIPEVEPYPEEDVSERERSLRAGGRAIGPVERIERLSRLLISAVAVVDRARVLDSYDWQSRLDDSKTSADAIEDAHELARMVDNYDRRRTAETERPPTPTIQPPPEWAWYLDGASPCVAGYRTEEAALAGAVRDYGEDHRIMVGQMRDVDPAELFDVNDVVDQAECRLNDLVEDGHVSACDGAAEALADWARRYLDVDPSRICEGRAVYPKKAAQKFAESVRELTGNRELEPVATDALEEETRL